MYKRKLGRQGLEVSALGLGCMGMSWAYGQAAEEEAAQRVLRRAIGIGVGFWDTAEMYGPYVNEELLGRALRTVRRTDVTVATKFAWRFDAQGRPERLDSSPAHVREALEGSLRRLGTDYVDLLYQHRLDPATPIEDTVGAMAELVRAGKVRYIGLSEVGPGTLRRAHAVHPVSALQTEYSLWERGPEDKILPACRELGIGFVAYSPLGRGFLTGRFRSPEDLEPSDWRRRNPRFLAEHFRHNLRLVEEVGKIAAASRATPGQVALAWLLRQGEDIVPIPGTRHVQHLEENAAAVDLRLPDESWRALDAVLADFRTVGARYPEEAMRNIDTTE